MDRSLDSLLEPVLVSLSSRSLGLFFLCLRAQIFFLFCDTFNLFIDFSYCLGCPRACWKNVFPQFPLTSFLSSSFEGRRE